MSACSFGTTIRRPCAQPVEQPAAGRAVHRHHSCSAPQQPQWQPPQTPAQSARRPPLCWPPLYRCSLGLLLRGRHPQPPASGAAGRLAWRRGPGAGRTGRCPGPPWSLGLGGKTCGAPACWPVLTRSILQAEALLCCPARWDLGHSCRHRRHHHCWLPGTACCCGGGGCSRWADGSGCRPVCGDGGGHGFCWRCDGG